MSKKLVILGAGISGYGAAVLGKQKGFDVFVTDRGVVKEELLSRFRESEITLQQGDHDMERILAADLVVKSPGIPDAVPLMRAILDAGIESISEIEFASRYTTKPIVAITGSNGKTTTTSLIGHILEHAGMNPAVGGNIGKSFALQVARDEGDIHVLEVSSFQLDGIKTFAPHIAILLNITPDHLDRYDYEFDKYIESKFQITSNQTADDYLIYNAQDPAITNYLESHTPDAKKVPQYLEPTTDPIPVPNAQLKDPYIEVQTDSTSIFEMSKDDLFIKGQHNVSNAMAAATTANLLKIRKETIRQSMAGFKGVPHRMEPVLRIGGVQYINDSKATNINAAYYALNTMTTEVVWIVGGVDKGNDYTELLPLVNRKVKAIICLGIDNTKIMDAYQNTVDVIAETDSMSEAVKMANKLADRGDSVLLSPACASFDLFENYEDRGNQFKAAIRKL